MNDHVKEDVMGITAEIRNSVNIFVAKPEGNIPLGRSWGIYENIIKQKLRKLSHRKQICLDKKKKTLNVQ
jgi:hypothetical protein